MSTARTARSTIDDPQPGGGQQSLFATVDFQHLAAAADARDHAVERVTRRLGVRPDEQRDAAHQPSPAG